MLSFPGREAPVGSARPSPVVAVSSTAPDCRPRACRFRRGWIFVLPRPGVSSLDIEFIVTSIGVLRRQLSVPWRAKVFLRPSVRDVRIDWAKKRRYIKNGVGVQALFSFEESGADGLMKEVPLREVGAAPD